MLRNSIIRCVVWIVLFIQCSAGYVVQHSARLEMHLQKLELPMIAIPDSSRNLNEDSRLQLKNYQGSLYTAGILIQGKQFTVQIDTGSADLWVSCKAFDESLCAANCGKNMTTILYGSGSICVESRTGEVEIGGIKIPKYTYGIGQGSNVVGNSTVLFGGSQGILGLAYPVISALNRTGTQIITKIDNFSMYLTPEDNSIGSLLIFNGVDDALISKKNLKPIRFPLIYQGHWSINMTSFRTIDPLGNTTNYTPCKGRSCSAIVDSGTTFLAMPKFIFTQFVNTYLIPGQCTWHVQYYICPKDVKLPRIGLSFTGENNVSTMFYLNSWDYSIVHSEKEIVIQLQRTPSGSVGDSWILGDTFLKLYYTLYQVNDSVTFYCSNGECNGGENLLNFSSSSKPSWAMILFIVGGVLVFGAIVATIWFCYLSRRKQASTNSTELKAAVESNDEASTPTTAYGHSTA